MREMWHSDFYHVLETNNLKLSLNNTLFSSFLGVRAVCFQLVHLVAL